MKKKIDDLQKGVDIWRTKAKELQKQLYEVASTQNHRGRRTSANRVSVTSVFQSAVKG